MATSRVKWVNNVEFAVNARNRAMERLTRAAYQAVKRVTPRGETGRLRANLIMSVGTEGGWGKVKIRQGKRQAPHAHLVLSGTAPHLTTAKTPGGVMAWKGAVAMRLSDRRALYRSATGRAILTKKRAVNTRFARGPIHHPGARANPFMAVGLAASRDAYLALAGQNLLQGLGL